MDPAPVREAIVIGVGADLDADGDVIALVGNERTKQPARIDKQFRDARVPYLIHCPFQVYRTVLPRAKIEIALQHRRQSLPVGPQRRLYDWLTDLCSNLGHAHNAGLKIMR